MRNVNYIFFGGYLLRDTSRYSLNIDWEWVSKYVSKNGVNNITLINKVDFLGDLLNQ